MSAWGHSLQLPRGTIIPGETSGNVQLEAWDLEVCCPGRVTANCRAARAAAGTATAGVLGPQCSTSFIGQKVPSHGPAERPSPQLPRAAVTPVRPWGVTRTSCKFHPLPMVGLALGGVFQNSGKAERDWSCSGGVSTLSSTIASLLGAQSSHQQNCSKELLWGETTVAWLPNPAL